MSIRRQMMVLIALPTLVIYVLVVGLTAVYVHRESRREVERDMSRLASSYAARFDGGLRKAAVIAEATAAMMETVQEVSDEEVYAILARNVGHTDLVYGACMAFEPGRRRPGGELFAPYVCRAAEGLRHMNIDESVYDWYRDPAYTWYSQPKALGRGVWSEPYFDEGAGNILMTTYSAPFRRGNAFGGVNTVDIDLPRLRETVGREFEDGLDFVILNTDGRFVFDPDPTRIMGPTIFERAEADGNAQLAALARRMLSGAPGLGAIDRWDAPGRTLVFYAPIPSTGWVFASRLPEAVVLADVRARTAWSAAALALALALTIGSISLVSRRIARPISRLRDKVAEVAAGDLEARIEDPGGADEIRTLARAFNDMTAELRAHIERLAAETAARRRFERDLDIARDIQRGLLPANRPQLRDYQIVGWSKAAEQTGGDYYDWQTLPDGRTIITLADVSGHGIGPALVTAVCRAYARATFATLQEFSPVIDQLNDLLTSDLKEGRFVTLVAALLHPESRRVELISAGHGPVLRYIAAEHRLEQLETTNLPLGIQPGLSYSPPVEWILSPGDFLMLTTDGFFEWLDANGQRFGLQRLNDTILELASLPAEDMIRRLYDRVRDFAGGAEQGDDVTAVVIRRAGD